MICSEIYDHHEALEQLERDGGELTGPSRSRETATVKSRLANLRRQWQMLCKQAKSESEALSSSAGHWHQFLANQQRLLPWLQSAERYMDEEVGKCGSLDEAQQERQQHAVSSCMYRVIQGFLDPLLEFFPPLSSSLKFSRSYARADPSQEGWCKPIGNCLLFERLIQISSPIGSSEGMIYHVDDITNIIP